jgi:hypothetical protein
VEFKDTSRSVIDYTKRLWRGDESLYLTYWGFGCIGGIAINKLFDYLVMQRVDAGWLILLAILFIAYWIFTSVAIWRSADNYKASTGSSVYANLAKVSVVLGGVLGLLRGCTGL